MSDPTLDPDLEQVLEDIAADPRAGLFVTDPRKVLTGLQDGSLETPASRTGLRPAERHLLEVYRHEMAFLLRQVYRVELDQRNTSIVIAQGRPVMSEIQKAIQALSKHAPSRAPFDGPLKYMREWPTCRTAAPLRTLSLSMTLEITHQSKIHLANEYVEREQPRTALHLALETVEARPGHQLLGYSLLSLGASQDLLERKDEAIEFYQSAFHELLRSSPEEALIAACNVLRLSIETGAPSQGLSSAKWIDQSFAPNSEDLLNNATAFRNSKHKDQKYTDAQKQLEKSVGSSAREIIHALS